MKYSTIALVLVLISTFSHSATDLAKKALKYVPEGTVQMVERDEFTIKTKSGSIIEVELNRDGSLDEASGEMAQKDDFVPGNGLISLSQAVKALQKEGKTVEGEWSLDKDFLRDWEYEFEGVEDGKQYEYTVNAKTGKLIKSEAD